MGIILVTLLILIVPPAGAFSLIGPYADWMDRTNSYRMGSDVGGPVDLGQGYRWDVPVVTYGFDQDFLEYFGTNGVKAVEEAIQLLNDVPPASSLNISNFPTDSSLLNFSAENVCDLKTAALSLLVEQIGLAEPRRSIFVLQRWNPEFLQLGGELDWPPGTIPEFIMERNFDPESLATSHRVNDVLFTGAISIRGPLTPNPQLAYVMAMQVDPFAIGGPAVADLRTYYIPLTFDWLDWLGGVEHRFFRDLTRDDVGALRFLLNPTNINVEPLLPDVHGCGSNAVSYVNLALRPGVDKVTFLPQQFDGLGQAIPLTNRFIGAYFTNGVLLHQELERVIARPDFLFCAADLTLNSPFLPSVSRTDTSNWWNSATLTGTGAAGPGIIRPPVRITFNKQGQLVQTDETSEGAVQVDVTDFRWASFDYSNNPVIPYPDGTPSAPNDELPVSFWVLAPGTGTVAGHLVLRVPAPFGTSAVLQTSTNLFDWQSVATVTNRGGVLTWREWFRRPSRFFRVLPQSSVSRKGAPASPVESAQGR